MEKQNIRIFIVDDNPTNVKMLSVIVKKEGLENVRKYTDPRLALEEFHQYKPHLILLDMQMPVINGLEFLKNIQAEIIDAQVAVIILTASNDMNIRLEALALGAQDYIEKPFNIIEVVQRINNVIHLQAKKQDLEELTDELGSELQQSYDTLKAVSRILTVLFSESSEFVFILKDRDLIIDANEAACKKFNFSLSNKNYLTELLSISKDELSNQRLIARQSDNSTPVIMQCLLSSLLVDGTPHHIFIGKDVTRREADEKQLRKMAESHYISSLPNKFQLNKEYQLHIQNKSLTASSTVILFIAFFESSKISQLYGPQALHQMIVSVAKILQQTVLKNNSRILHWSENEYVIICSEESLSNINKTISDEFSEAISTKEFTIKLSPKVGYYFIKGDEHIGEYDTFVHYASLAAHQGAKLEQQVTEYDEDLKKNLDFITLIEKGLLNEIQTKTFKMAYQPLVKLSTNIIIGVEALIRWEYGEYGMIPPDIFIPIAEKACLIEEIGSIVIDKVFDDYNELKIRYPHLEHVAINVAAPQLNKRLIVHLKENLIKYGLLPSQIKLELTETALLDSFERVIPILNELTEFGFKLALDDFGTGFSSLSYLQQMPVDTIKIDRSFINALHESEKSLSLVKSIISMSHSLGLTIVAEGIEDKVTDELMRTLKVQMGQGYLYSKPSFL